MLYLNIAKTDTNIVDHPNHMTMSIFLQGCDRIPHCKGCHNPSLWNKPNISTKMDSNLFTEILLDKDRFVPIQSITLVGGEPLATWNLDTIKFICTEFKRIYPDKKIFIYTYRSFKKAKRILKKLGIYNLISGGCFGPFEIDKYEPGSYPPSNNQIYMIDIQ